MNDASSVVSMLRLSSWAATAAEGMATTTAGSTRDLSPSLPKAGKICQRNENHCRARSATQKVGTETPSAGREPRRTRAGRHWTYVASSAQPKPNAIARRKPAPARCR